MCQESGKVQYNKAGIFLFFGGYMLRKYQGENLRFDSTLHIRSLPHDLVTGGIPHAGSRQRVSGSAKSQPGRSPPGHCSGFGLLSFLPPRAVRHTALPSVLTAQGHQTVCTPYRGRDSGARPADLGPGTPLPALHRGT